ncbi:glycosyl hydrolase [Stachybotrys elegans]|uniref:Endo-1,5-alpha-L-arabinanase A n=1 Tax=Stachybotrys elegans TaxID=80388 RepID=A0A8K0WN64_9HYPO|nr:glycosyl hydrolase [Stachybotrys elegans]
MRSSSIDAAAWLALLGLAYGASVEQVQAALETIQVHKIDNVKGNLHLPSVTTDGLEITWSSSNESIVAPDGRVKRQESNADVNLTASITDDDGVTHERLLTAKVKAAVQLDEFEGYAFSYFINNSLQGENIFFAASDGNDVLSWTELNNGQPVLRSTQGTRGLRDPFLIRSPEGDTFYLIATDLSIGSGTSWDSAVRRGSHYIEVWESSDLINWSEQRHIRVAPANAGNTWAPEAFYDEELGQYILFWASSLYAENDPNHTGSSYHRMMYATTRDFVTFGEPVIWQDAGMSRIDSTVIREGDTYYRFTKDEGAGGTGCSDIIQESSSSLRSTLESWSMITACIGRDAGTRAVEGPTVFKSNPGDVHGEKFYLFVDEYTGRGYIPLVTDDIANPHWTVPSSFDLPSSPRHGTVIPVTAAELAALRSNLPEYTGPVLPGYYADPNIAVFEGDCNYYIYATTDGTPGWSGQTFYSWKSRDLVDWTRSEQPFLTLDGADGNVPWAIGNAWAPTIVERDGTYYFYFSGRSATVDAIHMGVATADSPEGPFTALPEPMIIGNEPVRTSGSPIDPFVFHDPVSGRYYIYWGNGEPVYAQLNDDMVSVNWSTAAHQQGLQGYREASFMSYREGVYHMTYSVDDTRSENYRVGYATGPSPDGPWTYQGLILEKDVSQGILGTGHSSIVNVPNTDDWYIAYHRFGIPNGNGTMRETTIDKLFFDPETGLIQELWNDPISNYASVTRRSRSE